MVGGCSGDKARAKIRNMNAVGTNMDARRFAGGILLSGKERCECSIQRMKETKPIAFQPVIYFITGINVNKL